MKLFCSTKLQKKLGCKCEKAPIPDSPLDYWYANLIQLHGRDTILATLPDLRLCVLLYDFRADQYADLGPLLVQAIRKSLHEPYTRIPQFLIDQFFPADTVFEYCSTADRGVVSKMGAVTTQVLEQEYPLFSQGFDPQETQHAVNRGFITLEDGSPAYRWVALLELLQQRYGMGIPAMEVEFSLNLKRYTLRRTLRVPADTSFDHLQRDLHTAMRWSPRHAYDFVLPVRPGRDTEIHLCSDDLVEHLQTSGKSIAPSFDVRLLDHLQEGDSLQYICDREHNWVFDVKVTRYIPATEEDLPVCTAYEGKSPPEDVGGVLGFQGFCNILQARDNPKHRQLLQLLNKEWFQADNAEKISERLQDTFIIF